ncbi:SPOR domain-containing protein [Shimia sagamensis]|uniref:Sporulation related domain-containing protein n=1 Tax=Shimia sagamensis TaxID=1566352 RepID=A0ABY1P0Q9_9RHOB|nr:SPOR domain-containing protein [Shimia sagamensis]SMP23220.1 Sporulation related domain-containing protein [Shimia sagamensis]
MAEIPMGAHGAPKGDSPNAALLVSRAGMFVSLALVVGTGVWGFQILSRDVSGVPVVRALEGPMRIQPDNPGGRQAGHQGLMVNQVAADGSAAGPADQVIVAPPPISLTDRDMVTGAPVVVQPADNRSTMPNLVETEKLTEVVARAPIEPIVAPAPLDVSTPLSVEELAERLSAGATPLETVDVEDVKPIQVALKEPDVSVDVATADKLEIKGGLKRSLRPVLRPAKLSSVAQGTQVASIDAAVQGALKEVDAETIPAGTRLVQLGAYASPEIARAEWDKLQQRFDTYLGDKSRVIEKASSGGRVFYRLRAMGFETVSDARRLCSALKAENADCIPVTTR